MTYNFNLHVTVQVDADNDQAAIEHIQKLIKEGKIILKDLDYKIEQNG